MAEMFVLLSLSEIEIWVPEPDHSDMPALWWDMLSDKCLLLGVFKHGESDQLCCAQGFMCGYALLSNGCIYVL